MKPPAVACSAAVFALCAFGMTAASVAQNFGSTIRSDISKYGRIIRTAAIRVEQ
ncbi:MAG: hypothetical protein JWO70_2074 [Betaproteobacteria bacterium]|nr:hypothetical protein [Betaproteobacteria bacterium]